MAGKAGLKAGLIGAAVLVVLSLLSLIPIPALNCICCGVDFLVYIGIGVLGGYFLTPPRTAGTGAGAGAVAGVVSGLISGVVGTIIAVIQAAVGGATSMLDPGVLDMFGEFGAEIDPEMLEFFTDPAMGAGAGIGAGAIGGSICCLAGLVVGAGLGAIGGAIIGAAKSG